MYPWKFRLNHFADVLTKLGLGSFVVLSMVLDPGTDSINENLIGFFMIAFVLLPMTAVLVAIARHLYGIKVAKIKRLGQRERFAQRLHDVVKIASARSAPELRSCAFHILDNDYQSLNEALDVLQFTLLGLQPLKSRKWRCAPVPFELAVDGRLEGELKALGLEPEGDAREILRRLRHI